MRSLFKAEWRKLRYMPWIILITIAAALFLALYFSREYSAKADSLKTLFMLVLSEREYHACLYAPLAFCVFGLDICARTVDAGQMAGHSMAKIIGVKTVWFLASVFLLEVCYTAVCLIMCGGVAAVGDWLAFARAMCFRLIIDMGAASSFIAVQFLFVSLQYSLIANIVFAMLHIIIYRAHMEHWLSVLNYGYPPIVFIALSILAIIFMPAFAGMVYKFLKNKF